MILSGTIIKIMLFTILCICFIFYLFMGIYSYRKNFKSKSNVVFFPLCISISLWIIGYAFMLISVNIETANVWRIVSALGKCFFGGLWISFAFSLKETSNKKINIKIQFLVYIAAIIIFLSNFVYKPYEVVINTIYGFMDIYTTTTFGVFSSIYVASLALSGILIIYIEMKTCKKNRVRKQMKIILIFCLVSLCLAVIITSFILPTLGIVIFPSGIITLSIALGAVWYTINKHRMMSISSEFVSEYIFKNVNEPIFILGEDFLMKKCNEASLNITGYNYTYLEQNLLTNVLNFRNFEFNTIIQVGNMLNIEVDLCRQNKESLVCEVSATIIYDEYKDILGILLLLHDVSERKRIAEIQKTYTTKLEHANLMLKTEITDRLLAEEKIRHLVYYDALTEVSNRKKMLEDVNILLNYKDKKFAILFIDLDKFKIVNDNYGHQAGDYILKTVAARLKSIIRSTDTISRIGGDEFIIVLGDLKSSDNAENIAMIVLKELCRSFTYNENQLFIGGSIGISIFPDHGIDADTLIKNADLAMYEVKLDGGNSYKLYSFEMNVDYLKTTNISHNSR